MRFRPVACRSVVLRGVCQLSGNKHASLGVTVGLAEFYFQIALEYLLTLEIINSESDMKIGFKAWE